MIRMRILVIEDEPQLGDYLKKGLEDNGYEVDIARDGIEGRYLANENDYALVLLDVMLPAPDGFAVLQSIKRTKNVPVMVLTARDRVEDRVAGLQQGVDDFVVKPFTLTELIARIQLLLRRIEQAEPVVLRLADLELNTETRHCTRDGVGIDLTGKEFALLVALFRKRGKILSRATLAEQVWDASPDSDTNVVEVGIRRLRSKLDDPFERKLLHTVRGSGYVLEDRSWT